MKRIAFTLLLKAIVIVLLAILYVAGEPVVRCREDAVQPFLVFVYNDKVFATMLTLFFKEDAISDKPDSELERLMSQSPS